MKGFSPQNLKYMRKFAEEFPSDAICQQAVDQLPWGHVVSLLYAVSSQEERSFYIQGTLEKVGHVINWRYKLKPICLNVNAMLLPT